MSDAKALAEKVLRDPPKAYQYCFMDTLARAVLDMHKELVWQRDQTNTQARAECEMRKQRDAARAEVERLTEELSDSEMRCDTLCRVNSAGKKQVERLRGALKDLVTYFTDNGAGGTVIERARAALGRR